MIIYKIAIINNIYGGWGPYTLKTKPDNSTRNQSGYRFIDFNKLATIKSEKNLSPGLVKTC